MMQSIKSTRVACFQEINFICLAVWVVYIWCTSTGEGRWGICCICYMLYV